MTTLYELRAADGRSFSPFCWRARMALAHKGVVPELVKVRFTDIGAIGHQARTVPVLVDGDAVVRDSWDIALHLDRRLPDAPPLFPDAGAAQHARFLHQWVVTQLHLPIFRTVAADIWDRLDAADQPYFRESREKRLGGAKLESVRQDQAATVAQFRSALAPLRAIVEQQPFVSGAAPAYGDYIVFGALQWARVISPVRMLEPQDAVQQWFERCLDLHGGVGRAEPPAASD
jgi:glutathione S-transferase